jgi:hypothetical protein
LLNFSINLQFLLKTFINLKRKKGSEGRRERGRKEEKMRGSEGRREKQKEDRKRGELCQKHR